MQAHIPLHACLHMLLACSHVARMRGSCTRSQVTACLCSLLSPHQMRACLLHVRLLRTVHESANGRARIWLAYHRGSTHLFCDQSEHAWRLCSDQHGADGMRWHHPVGLEGLQLQGGLSRVGCHFCPRRLFMPSAPGELMQGKAGGIQPRPKTVFQHDEGARAAHPRHALPSWGYAAVIAGHAPSGGDQAIIVPVGLTAAHHQHGLGPRHAAVDSHALRGAGQAGQRGKRAERSQHHPQPRVSAVAPFHQCSRVVVFTAHAEGVLALLAQAENR